MSGISSRLSALIEESGLSYTELEKKTKVPKSALQRYATGITTNIPVDRLKIIAEALGTNVAYLLGWESGPLTSFEKEYALEDAWFALKADMESKGIHPDDIREIMDAVDSIEKRRKDP